MRSAAHLTRQAVILGAIIIGDLDQIAVPDVSTGVVLARVTGDDSRAERHARADHLHALSQLEGTAVDAVPDCSSSTTFGLLMASEQLPSTSVIHPSTTL